MRWWGWWAAGVLGLAAVLGLALALGPSGRTAAPAAGGSPPSDSGLNNSFTTAAIDSCVRPRPRPGPAAGGIGGIPAYALDGTLLDSTVRAGHEPGTHPRCADGELRILRLTGVTVDGGPAYLRRGGCQTPCVVRQPTVLVRAADLAQPVVPLPAAVLAGDGAPAPGCTRTVTSTPARAGPALGRMFYKTPAEIGATRRRTAVAGAGALWSNYGDPGRRFRSASGTHSDYTYLLWNLPRRGSGGPLPGGGIARAPLADGEPLELCPTLRLTLPSFDVDGAPNGSVVFGYARARDASGAPVYGWVLLGYRYADRRFKDTVAPA